MLQIRPLSKPRRRSRRRPSGNAESEPLRGQHPLPWGPAEVEAVLSDPGDRRNWFDGIVARFEVPAGLRIGLRPRPPAAGPTGRRTRGTAAATTGGSLPAPVRGARRRRASRHWCDQSPPRSAKRLSARSGTWRLPASRPRPSRTVANTAAVTVDKPRPDGGGCGCLILRAPEARPGAWHTSPRDGRDRQGD
jgi:hypothetical protein